MNNNKEKTKKVCTQSKKVSIQAEINGFKVNKLNRALLSEDKNGSNEIQSVESKK